MDSPITVDGFETPRNRRARPEGAIVDVGGWLRAPTTWTGEKRLEAAWNRRHESHLGVGLNVANNPRRRIMLTNVTDDLAWVRKELESIIAEVEPASQPSDA